MDADLLLATLGRRIRSLRAARGFTLKELAERAEFSSRFLVQLESGTANVSVRKLAALARALGTTPAELLSGPGGEAEMPVIALLGLRGAGKSTIGRRLARRLRVPFVELDRRVEEAAGLSLDEIFALHGQDYYRRLERDALERLLAEDRPAVVATGGGIVTSGRPTPFSAAARSRCGCGRRRRTTGTAWCSRATAARWRTTPGRWPSCGACSPSGSRSTRRPPTSSTPRVSGWMKQWMR